MGTSPPDRRMGNCFATGDQASSGCGVVPPADSLLEAVRECLISLAKATPAQKAMHDNIGLRLIYYPEDDTLDIESRPDACAQVNMATKYVSFL